MLPSQQNAALVTRSGGLYRAGRVHQLPVGQHQSRRASVLTSTVLFPHDGNRKTHSGGAHTPRTFLAFLA